MTGKHIIPTRLNCKGMSIIETGMVASLFMIFVVAISTVSKSAVADSQIEKPTKPLRFQTASSLERMKQEGPTAYQLDLLRQANEAHEARGAGKSITVPAKGEGPTPFQLELLRKANEAHAEKMRTKPSSSEPIGNDLTIAESNATPEITAVVHTPVHEPSVTGSKVLERPTKPVTSTADVWTKVVSGKSLTLSVQTGNSHATIDWGDGSTENVYARGTFQGGHRYADEGAYTITIQGKDFRVTSYTEPDD